MRRLVMLIGGLTVGLSAVAQAATTELPPSSFDAPRRTILPMPSLPPADKILAGDFDGDGLDDLVALRNDGFSSAELILYRGFCDGSFSEAFRQALQPGFIEIQSSDFNGDGTPELLVHGNADGADVLGWLQILKLGGQGFEIAFESSSVEIRQGSVAIADFDQDGKLDFVSRTSNPLGPTLYLGLGDGQRFLPRQLGLTANMSRPKVGDFNGDGFPDLIFRDGATWLALNDGAGGFDRRILLDLGNIHLLVRLPSRSWSSGQ